MRILLLNQTFYPDVASTAQHLTDLAVQLAGRGHDVTVVCGRRAYDNPAERYPRREMSRGVRIRRIASFTFGKRARWRRAADFGSYLANCFVHLAFLPRFDVVVALTSPPLISWLGALFTRLKGGRFVFWAMDLNPDEALAAGWLRKDSLTSRCLQALLTYSLHQADTVIVLDRFMAELVRAKGVPAGNLTVIPPWPHEDVVRYDAGGRQRFRSAHGLDGKYVVMYSGNHSPCHPLTTLLEAALRLRERPDIAFCFVGGGSEFDTVRRYAKRYELQNVQTIPYQPLCMLAASLSAADLHAVVMGDPFVGLVHPCKVYNIRTLGIPYLYIGPTESHIADLNPTFAARHGDVDAVVQHILSAAAEANANAGRAEFVSPHTQSHSISQLMSALEAATSRPSRQGLQARVDAA